MKINYINKCVVVLGFVFFFILFLPVLQKETLVYGSSIASKDTVILPKDSTDKDTTKETQPEIKLNVKSKALVKEKSFTLKTYNLTELQSVIFKSSAPDIASVDENGVVTGNAIGTATITITVKENNKVISTLQCEIMVGPPAISVKWTKSEITLTVDKKITLKTILQPYNTAEEVRFLCNDNTIASVSTGGRVTAKSVGTVQIFAIIDNNIFDTCTVTVVEKETATEENADDGTSTGAEIITPEVTTPPAPTSIIPFRSQNYNQKHK